MKTILDLGCGTGNNLKKYYKKNKIVGIDLSKENIDICKKNMPNGTWIVGDATKYSLKNYKKPLQIICTEVIEHIPNWEKLIKNLQEAPKNSTLYLTTPIDKSEKKLIALRPKYWKEIGHHHFFNGHEIKKELTKIGWKNIKIKRHNAALYFELKALFKKNAKCIRNTYYENTLPFYLRLFFQLFRKDLFKTKLKYFPIWIITLPLAKILDKFYGAGIIITAKKK